LRALIGCTRAGIQDLSVVAAVVLVAGVGLLVHRPLSRVPENTIKFTVGVALTTFGTFWGGEGVGVDWRLGDAMLLLLAGFYAAAAFGLVTWLKATAASGTLATPEGSAA
jgi:uncharacterized membrane protein